ncbi:MAG: helix-turn-helix domain-containing protein, partial [Lacrimispora sphenoides]
KYLLNTEDANISEVSYSVGYDDYRSFYRAFKKHTGLTPSEYQTGQQKGENNEKSR